MKEEVKTAEKPENLSVEEAVDRGLDSTWYNDGIKYTARLYYESAKENDEVLEKFQERAEKGDVDKLSFSRELRNILNEHDADTIRKIDNLNLSAFQGLNAEKITMDILREEEYITTDEEI